MGRSLKRLPPFKEGGRLVSNCFTYTPQHEGLFLDAARGLGSLPASQRTSRGAPLAMAIVTGRLFPELTGDRNGATATSDEDQTRGLSPRQSAIGRNGESRHGACRSPNIPFGTFAEGPA